MKELDPATLEALILNDIDPGKLKKRNIKAAPGNLAGLPGLLAYDSPQLTGTNTAGLVTASPRLKDFDENRGRAQAIITRPGTENRTLFHEAEHLLARQQLGHPAEINNKFISLTKSPISAFDFVQNAIQAEPYLKEKYGLNSAYFQLELAKMQSNPGVLLYEQLADLAAIEHKHNVDLTKDPVLRKTLFKDRDIRETYNAITGLRQTRLDPRDLPPYTRQPEEPGMIDKIKKLFSKAEGGSIHQREPKYI